MPLGMLFYFQNRVGIKNRGIHIKKQQKRMINPY
jgi:hypothetical protein